MWTVWVDLGWCKFLTFAGDEMQLSREIACIWQDAGYGVDWNYDSTLAGA